MERQYIGARYVPVFADPVEWSDKRVYESLTIVTYLGSSYTSKKKVPSGVRPTNTEYWVLTGNYNAQIEEYRQNIVALSEKVGNTDFLHNKRIWIYGDSISDETSASVQGLQPNWVARFREKLPENTSVTNRSLAGRFVTGVEGIAYVMQREGSIYADIVIIFAGVNDFRHSRTLGTLSDSDWSTFGGALKIISTELKEKCPKADVFVVSPLKNFETKYPETHITEQFCQLYREQLRMWCGANSYRYIDGYSAPMLNPASQDVRNLYQPDGLHPNASYAPLLCEYIYNHILTNSGSAINKRMFQINVSKYLENVIDGTAYGALDEQGNIQLIINGSAEVTEGEQLVFFTFPDFLKPYGSYGFSARCQIGSNFTVQPVNMTANNMVIRVNASGTCYFSLSVTYKPTYCNSIYSSSV